jgi:uncharacterized membrane protein YagU involved in acid resistance
MKNFIEEFGFKKEYISFKNTKNTIVSIYRIIINVLYFSIIIAMGICLLIAFWQLAGWNGIICLILFLSFCFYRHEKSK